MNIATDAAAIRAAKMAIRVRVTVQDRGKWTRHDWDAYHGRLVAQRTLLAAKLDRKPIHPKAATWMALLAHLNYVVVPRFCARAAM